MACYFLQAKCCSPTLNNAAARSYNNAAARSYNNDAELVEASHLTSHSYSLDRHLHGYLSFESLFEAMPRRAQLTGSEAARAHAGRQSASSARRGGSGEGLVSGGLRSPRLFEGHTPYRRRHSTTPDRHTMLAVSSTNPAFGKSNGSIDSLVSAHSSGCGSLAEAV